MSSVPAQQGIQCNRDRVRLFERSAEGSTVVLERAVEGGKPTRVIVDYAEDEFIDHVVMGSHGRQGVSRLLGSVAKTVVRRSPVPVTVTR